ncbi:MAG: YciI family protein [Pseudomonadota bacterium]
MQYLLLINEDESVYAGKEGGKLMEATLAGHMKLIEELNASGVEFSGNRLKSADTATTLRYENGGEPVLRDGAFPETHEELGGYYLIDVADLDSAIAWARKIPIPGTGAVEVRPVWQD